MSMRNGPKGSMSLAEIDPMPGLGSNGVCAGDLRFDSAYGALVLQ